MNPKDVLRRFARCCPLLRPSLTFSILCFLSDPAIGAQWDVAGKAAVLMEMPTGKILWEKNKAAPRPPASTAKILTALVTLDRVPLKEIVTVSITATANNQLRGCPQERRTTSGSGSALCLTPAIQQRRRLGSGFPYRRINAEVRSDHESESPLSRRASF